MPNECYYYSSDYCVFQDEIIVMTRAYVLQSVTSALDNRNGAIHEWTYGPATPAIEHHDVKISSIFRIFDSITKSTGIALLQTVATQ